MNRNKYGNMVPLSSLLEEMPQNGYSPICPNDPTGKWVLGLSALNGHSLNLTEAKPAPINDPIVDRFLLRPGDFLISRSNTIDKVGRVGVFRGGLENCAYPDLMMRFRPDASKINPDYLEVYLKSEVAVKYIQSHATGTSGSMKKINQGIVEKIPVLLLSFKEQNIIASINVAWDGAIEITEKLIKAKQEVLFEMYNRLFAQQRPVHFSWGRYKIAQLLTERNEKTVPNSDIPLYSLTIEDGVTAKTDRYNRDFLVKDAESKVYKVVYPGDIVFNPANLRWGAIARSEISHKVAVSPIYEVLEVRNDMVSSDLLSHALMCPRQIKRFALLVEGTLIERMAVKLETFLSAEVILPINRQQQDKTAELLNSLKREIDLLKKQVEAYRKQKRGLMQKLLTGKWRVKAAEEVS